MELHTAASQYLRCVLTPSFRRCEGLFREKSSCEFRISGLKHLIRRIHDWNSNRTRSMYPGQCERTTELRECGERAKGEESLSSQKKTDRRWK